MINYINILKNISILYVEDEDNIRKNITDTLLLMNCKVYDVNSVEKATEVFRTTQIDIIISDIRLPNTNGIDFCKQIREKDFKIPIILLTAHLDTNYLLDATRLKLVDYLIKPIDFKTLKVALFKCVDELILQNRFNIYFQNGVHFSISNKMLYNNMDEIKLTQSELTLLDFLIESKNRITSHDELKRHLWNDSEKGSDSALKNILNKLRNKIGKESILNTSGIGFRLKTKND